MNQSPAIPEAPPVAAPRRILRSRTNRVLAGVCGGLAEAYGSDPTAIRLLTVIIAVFTGLLPMLILYLVAAVIIPERGEGGLPVEGTGAPSVVTPRRGGLVVGMVLIGAGVLALANEWYGIDWSLLWPAALIVLGGGLIVTARR
jgi:phage shock protein C